MNWCQCHFSDRVTSANTSDSRKSRSEYDTRRATDNVAPTTATSKVSLLKFSDK